MEASKNDVIKGVRVTGEYYVKEYVLRVLKQDNPENAEIETVDTLVSSEETDTGFVLTFTRAIGFVPSGIFETIVTILANVEFENDAGKKILKSSEERKDWIENNKIRIANTFGMPATASVMIASAMVHAGFGPMVTPPSVIIKQQ